MAYEKRDFAYFKKHLSEGGYVDIGGARKSIGKMAIPDEEKVAAEKLAVKHFGADAAPAPKAKKGKTAPRKAATKAAREAKAPKAKAAAAPPAAKVRKTRGPGRKAAGTQVPVATMLNEHSIRIGTVQQALKAMSDAKQLGAEASEVAIGARKAQGVLTSIVSSLCPTSNEPTPEDLRQAEALEKAARVAGVPQPGGNTQGTT